MTIDGHGQSFIHENYVRANGFQSRYLAYLASIMRYAISSPAGLMIDLT